MRKLPVILAIVWLFASAFDDSTLLKKPIPILDTKTLDGKTIDEAYFKGHYTLVSLMYIGCLPCMNEISALNQLQKEYASKNLQVLCIAMQMPSQMVSFNAGDNTQHGKLRKAMKVPPIEYTIQPGCPEGPTKMEFRVTDGDTSYLMKYECNTVTDVYKVKGYPTLLFVDKNGIVQDIKKGGPGEPNDTAFYNGLNGWVQQHMSKNP